MINDPVVPMISNMVMFPPKIKMASVKMLIHLSGDQLFQIS